AGAPHPACFASAASYTALNFFRSSLKLQAQACASLDVRPLHEETSLTRRLIVALTADASAISLAVLSVMLVTAVPAADESWPCAWQDTVRSMNRTLSGPVHVIRTIILPSRQHLPSF